MCHDNEHGMTDEVEGNPSINDLSDGLGAVVSVEKDRTIGGA